MIGKDSGKGMRRLIRVLKNLILKRDSLFIAFKLQIRNSLREDYLIKVMRMKRITKFSLLKKMKKKTISVLPAIKWLMENKLMSIKND